MMQTLFFLKNVHKHGINGRSEVSRHSSNFKKLLKNRYNWK